MIWHNYMSVATAHMKPVDFPIAPSTNAVTLKIDVTRGCLANQFTPPQDIEQRDFVSGSEPNLKVCTEPSSYQDLVVPSVIGLGKDDAISALHQAGFNVAIDYERSGRDEGTVLTQDPTGGAKLEQTGTVTISVSRGASAATEVDVPDVVGVSLHEAAATLRRAGFQVTVVKQAECNPSAPSCDAQSGVVWSQTPTGGQASPSSSPCPPWRLR
jgi:hypothetical protein